MRKRLRIVGAPESFGPLTQVARPVVAAKSPAPIVESATISIEEIAIWGNGEQGGTSLDRRTARPHEDRVFRIGVHPRRRVGILERLGKSQLGCPDGGVVGGREAHDDDLNLLGASIRDHPHGLGRV